MKSITFTTFALTAAILSTLASGLAPSTAAAADYGYVNYRNYDKGPESLAAFRARTNSTVGTAIPSGFNDRGDNGLSEAACYRSASQLSTLVEQRNDRHCDLQPKHNRSVTHVC